MNTKLRKQPGQVHRRKGQSIVEFALGSIFLVMLLATAIDLGRAFFTWQVVHQMAAEGAAYLARYPDNTTYSTTSNDSYQARAMNVGTSAGRIFDPSPPNFDPTSSSYVSYTVVGGAPMCMGNQFTVYVSYHMSDLFIPAFFGVKSLNLGAEETSVFLSKSSTASCPP